MKPGRVLGCVALLWLSSGLLAQPGSHAYRVHVGDGGWVTPEEARARGYMLYMERWVPAKLRSQLRRWERHDARVDGYKDAYRVKSEHYRIKTNAPRMVVELEIKPFLDELYRTYVEVFRRDFGLRAKAADKNHIHIYWGFPSWRDEQGEDRCMPGFYRPGGPLTVLYDPTDPDDFHNTVFHEGALCDKGCHRSLFAAIMAIKYAQHKGFSVGLRALARHLAGRGVVLPGRARRRDR